MEIEEGKKFPNLLILNEENKIIRIINKSNHQIDYTVDIVVSLAANPAIKLLVNSLKNSVWQNVILNEKYMVSLV